MNTVTLRPATLDDRADIERLIRLSSRTLGSTEYTGEQIESALLAVLGVDSSLIRDGTYYVAELEGTLVGCGGWSHRKTLFGGDRVADRDDGDLDPRIDAAKIRAFYVHPDHARQGIGTLILQHCEQAARDRGFSRFELGATLPGQKLFRSRGYLSGTAFEYETTPGCFMTIVPMQKAD